MEVRRKKGLATCPLCNNDAVYVYYKGGVFVKCTCCECMIAKQISVTTENILPFETEEEATKVWNRRGGFTAEAKRMPGRSTPEEILKARDLRVEKIVRILKIRKNEYVTVQEIADETGITHQVIRNSMHYIKKIYPQVKARKGLPGYSWEE